jgi:hypothetical protein
MSVSSGEFRNVRFGHDHDAGVTPILLHRSDTRFGAERKGGSERGNGHVGWDGFDVPPHHARHVRTVLDVML